MTEWLLEIAITDTIIIWVATKSGIGHGLWPRPWCRLWCRPWLPVVNFLKTVPNMRTRIRHFLVRCWKPSLLQTPYVII